MNGQLELFDFMNLGAVESAPQEKEAPIDGQIALDNVVAFPQSHEYEDCFAKLDTECRELFNGDSDSRYVVDALLELCKVDEVFRERVMRPDKSYKGAFEYFAGKARAGECIKICECSYLDNDKALGFAIEYFEAD